MSDAQQEEVDVTTTRDETGSPVDDYIDPWEEGVINLPLAMD